MTSNQVFRSFKAITASLKMRKLMSKNKQILYRKKHNLKNYMKGSTSTCHTLLEKSF